MPTVALTPDEKRLIVARFYDLQVAIAARSPSLSASYEAFRAAYRGNRTNLVAAFWRCESDRDRERWISRLTDDLIQHIEGPFWAGCAPVGSGKSTIMADIGCLFFAVTVPAMAACGGKTPRRAQ